MEEGHEAKLRCGLWKGLAGESWDTDVGMCVLGRVVSGLSFFNSICVCMSAYIYIYIYTV